MLRFFWKWFPSLYPLPFLMATMRIEQIEALGITTRWVVLGIGTLVAIAIAFGTKSFGGKRHKPILFESILVAFLALFLASDFWSIQPGSTAQRALSLIFLYLTSFWAMWKYADVFSEEQLAKRILISLGIIFALNTFIPYFLLSENFLVGRYRGFFINPNNIGILLGVAFPLAFIQWAQTRQRIYFFMFAIFAANLLASGNRSAILGAIIALIITLTSLMAKKPNQVILVSVITISGLALLSLSQTDFLVEQVIRVDSLSTASNRTEFWDLALDYIAKRPDFGHGFGTEEYVHEYYNVSLKDLRLRGYGVMSSYLGLAVQMGWPVTFLFFGSVFSFIFKHFLSHWQDYILVGYLATLTSGLIIGIFEPAIFSAGNIFSFLFWLVLMLSVRKVCYLRKYGTLTQPIH
jgi:O-antigen ligase